VAKTEDDFRFRIPTKVIADRAPTGLQLTTVSLLDSTTGLPVEQRMPRSPAGGDASATGITYISRDVNAAEPEHGEEPCAATAGSAPNYAPRNQHRRHPYGVRTYVPQL